MPVSIATNPNPPVYENSFSLQWNDTLKTFDPAITYTLYINNIVFKTTIGTNFSSIFFIGINVVPTLGQGTYPLRVTGADGYDEVFNSLHIACFLKGTKILCINDNDEKVYKNIEEIEENSYVETYKHGAKKVLHRTKQFHKNELSPAQMCKIPKNNELFEDLYITGTHSLMVNKLSRTELKNILTIQDEPTIVDGKYLINTYLKEGVELINDEKTYEVYHLVLENDDIDGIYGIYANGLLAESMNIAFYNKNFGKNSRGLSLE